jgi:hypothetical protein
MNRRHAEVFQRVLSVRISDEERMKRGIEIGELQAEAQQLEDEFKTAKAAFDRRKKQLAARVKELGEITRTGREDRAVDCQRRFDHASNRVVEIRLDTLDEINSREMNQVERQMFFNFTVVEPQPSNGNGDSYAADTNPEQTDSEATSEPGPPTAEQVKQAASFNEAETQFQQEVSQYEDSHLQQSLAELAQVQGVEATPTSQLKLRLLRDEVNRRGDMSPDAFGVYRGFEQTEVLSKEGEGWRVTIQTLHTPVGWIRSFTFFTQFGQSGGEPLTATHAFDNQVQAVMDAAFRLKVANRRDPQASSEQKKAAQQISKYAEQLIASFEQRLDEADQVDDETEQSEAAD